MPDNMKQEHDNLSNVSKQSFKENNNYNICGSKIWRYLFLIKDSTVSMIIQFLHFPVMLNYVSGLYAFDTSLCQKFLKSNEKFIPKILWETSPPPYFKHAFYHVLYYSEKWSNFYRIALLVWWASGCRSYRLKLSSLSWFEEKYQLDAIWPTKILFQIIFRFFLKKKIYSI